MNLLLALITPSHSGDDANISAELSATRTGGHAERTRAVDRLYRRSTNLSLPNLARQQRREFPGF
jgi:hypothetical protein